ncbi:MAG: hypothetical protein F6K22_31335 [Okeania sp. SIO2F4]|uniref:hypothetical protein n=1 Tax=Okeania sp. SIO2F4 TaxID=2607790 RepID=UPI00142D068B|nr:hypothetical protein [Okeania sp. SIO2F4]NES06913.1 hypothetical protein [Okeania sp. SIO2F4]
MATKKVYLDEWQFCHFPEIFFSSISHLEFQVPYYFPDISIAIKQYSEDIADYGNEESDITEP